MLKLTIYAPSLLLLILFSLERTMDGYSCRRDGYLRHRLALDRAGQSERDDSRRDAYGGRNTCRDIPYVPNSLRCICRLARGNEPRTFRDGPASHPRASLASVGLAKLRRQRLRGISLVPCVHRPPYSQPQESARERPRYERNVARRGARRVGTLSGSGSFAGWAEGARSSGGGADGGHATGGAGSGGGAAAGAAGPIL